MKMQRNATKVYKYGLLITVLVLLHFMYYDRRNVQMYDYVDKQNSTGGGMTGMLADFFIKQDLLPDNFLFTTGNRFSGYTKSLMTVFRGVMTPVGKVESADKDTVTVGLIIVNIKKTKFFDQKFADGTSGNLNSLISQAKSRPLHIIIVTDTFSRRQAGVLIGQIISKKIAMDIIKNVYQHKHNVPPPKVSFVDYREIVKAKPEYVDKFKNMNMTDSKTKYNNDFFYIGPLYHLAFTNLDRFIFLDSQDLEIRIDIAELDEQFDKFLPWNILGMANDLSPFYWLRSEKYRGTHPGSHIGDSRETQGFNSGVVLYNLKRIRKNKIYNRYLEPDQLEELLNYHGFRAILGDQDWFTNLGFIYPELFQVLDCRFNTQTSIEYMRSELKDLFDDFHFCDKYDKIKIVHFNGCGMEPRLCGHMGDPKKHMSPMFKAGYYFLGKEVVQMDWMYFKRKEEERLKKKIQ